MKFCKTVSHLALCGIGVLLVSEVSHAGSVKLPNCRIEIRGDYYGAAEKILKSKGYEIVQSREQADAILVEARNDECHDHWCWESSSQVRFVLRDLDGKELADAESAAEKSFFETRKRAERKAARRLPRCKKLLKN